MFRLIKIEGGRINVPEPQIFETQSEIVDGQALVLTNGYLTVATGGTKPTFMALANAHGTSSKAVEVHVARVEPNQIYEVPVSTSTGLTSLKVGNKVTIEASASATDNAPAIVGGLRVTATTTSGVAEIVSLNGATNADDTIIVRFS